VTWTRVKATGRGRVEARLAIAGLQGSFVTDHRMVQTAADGRTWYNGLDPSTIKWSVNADLMRASLNVEGFTATIKDISGNATRVLGKRPTQSVSLTADAGVADTSFEVSDTSGWPSAGYGHIATEAFSYSSKDATHFLGVTRAKFGTIAQAHYIADGAGLAFPKVTDVPVGLEGRTCELALYGDGDSKTGDGTTVFRGVCNRGARFENGTWTIGIDPITRVLDQSIGGDLSEPVPIRGITYTSAVPMRLVIVATGAGIADVTMFGHWESEEDKCRALTAEIAAATSAFTWAAGSAIRAIAEPGGWLLEYSIGAAGTAPDVVLDTSSVSGRLGPGGDGRASSFPLDTPLSTRWTNPDGTPVGSFANGGTYRLHYAAPFPRGVVGVPDLPRDTVVVGTPTDGEPYRIYLGGVVAPTTNMRISIENGSEDGVDAAILAVNTGDRTVDVSTLYTILGPDTKLRIGRVLADGASLNTLRAALVADSPTYANAGAMPLIGPLDIVDSPEVDRASIANMAIGYGRTYVAYDGMTLAEIVEHALRAIGCYQRISDGSIEWKKIRATMTSDTADWTVGEGDIVGYPVTERGQFGMLSEVEMRTGWDPKENEHVGQVFRFRDVGACSPNRVSQTLEIAQLSLPPALRGSGAGPSINDVRTAVQPVLGLFGVEYDVITLNVGIRFFSAKVGDTVSLTSSKVPNVDGTRGVSDELCLLIGTTFDLSSKRIGLSLLRHGQRLAGYAPEFRCDPGDAGLVGGTTYRFPLQISDYTTAAGVGTWLTVGDLVRVTEQDTTTPTTADGEITLIDGDEVEIDFGGAFTPGTSEWSVGARPATAYASTDSLARFMFVAGTDRRISFSSGDVDARVFSP
jgi:hypothetical protein